MAEDLPLPGHNLPMERRWPTDNFYLLPEACAADEPLQPDDTRYVDFRPLRHGFSMQKFENWLKASVALNQTMKRCFSGHRGSGKTTELLKLGEWANNNGFLTYRIDVTNFFSLTDIHAADLLLLAVTAADEAMHEYGHPLDPILLKKIIRWLGEVTEEEKRTIKSGISMEVEVQLAASVPLFGKLMAKFQVGTEDTQEDAFRFRKQMRNSPDLLCGYANELLNAANTTLRNTDRPGGLLLIFDSLDKYDANAIDTALFRQPELLEMLECHIIFTMPILLAYSPISPQERFGTPVILPMLALRDRNAKWANTIAASSYLEDRVALVREGLRKRVVLEAVFEHLEDIDTLIKLSGGCIRDLMHLIVEAFSEVEDGEHITTNAVRRSIATLRNNYIRQLSAEDYAYLAEIAHTNSVVRADRRAINLQRHPFYFLYALEYLDGNGDLWVDIHPLIAETEGFRRASTLYSASGRLMVYLLSVEVQNVRCFGQPQTLDLSDEHGKPAQWTVILGNNGVGKTTLLKSIAALDSTVSPLFLTEQHLFERRLDGTGIAIDGISTHVSNGRESSVSGRIYYGADLKSSGLGQTREVLFVRSSSHSALNGTAKTEMVERPEKVTGLICYAYGAARRMGESALSSEVSDFHYASLFSDDIPLQNAEEWLLQTDYAASKPSIIQERTQIKLTQIKQLLIDLLPDVEDIRILAPDEQVPQSRVEFKTTYGWSSIQHLSLGYRTLIAWMVDFARRMYDRYPESLRPLEEPAIVLVDEIDLHLHPRWQRELIGYLSKWFPATQFIVTAHSPLVVQAAANANIVLLRPSDRGDQVEISNDVTNVRGYRVDQVLTSDLFDLPSVRPPDLDRPMEERANILSKANITPEDEARLKELEDEIGDLPTGDTSDEREAMRLVMEGNAIMEAVLRKAGILNTTGG